MPSTFWSSVSPLVQWTNNVCLSNIRWSRGEDTFQNSVPELLDIVFKQCAKTYTSGKSVLALVSERKQLAKANPFWGVSWVLTCHSNGEAGKSGDNGWNKARKWSSRSPLFEWVSSDKWWGKEIRGQAASVKAESPDCMQLGAREDRVRSANQGCSKDSRIKAIVRVAQYRERSGSPRTGQPGV